MRKEFQYDTKLRPIGDGTVHPTLVTMRDAVGRFVPAIKQGISYLVPYIASAQYGETTIPETDLQYFGLGV